MHSIIFLIMVTVLKSAVFGCPSACTCHHGTPSIICESKGLSTVPAGIPSSTTHLWVSKTRCISWYS